MLTHRVRQILQSLWASVAIQMFLFVSGILVARVLGPAGRGNLAIVLALPMVATQVVSAGVPSAVTYFIARNRLAWRPIVRRLALISAAQVALAVVLLVGLNAFFLAGKSPDTHAAAVLALASTPLLIAQYYGVHVLQGLSDLRWFNIYRAAPAGLYALGLAIALTFNVSVVTCTAVWLGSQLMTAVALGAHLVSRPRVETEAGSIEAAAPSQRSILRFALAGFLAQVSPIETFRVDTLFVAALFPSAVVGYYAVASSVSNIPRFIADGIVGVGYPHVAEQDAREGRVSTKRYLLAASVLCGASAAVLALTLQWIVPLLFGHRFAPAINISVVLVVAAGLISVRRVGVDCLRALGRPGAATINEVLTGVVIVVGFGSIGHLGGGEGVALSLAIAASAGLGLLLLLLRKPRVDGRRAS